MIKSTTYCDCCQAAKKEVNDWWRVSLTVKDGSKHLAITSASTKRNIVSGDRLDVCSEKCLHEVVSKWIAGK